MGEFREYNLAMEKEQRLITLLKERGLEDPETHALLIKRATEIDQEAERANNNRAYVEADLKKARLYLAAGFEDEAYESFSAARQAAAQEGFDDLKANIESEMSVLEE